MILGVVCTAAFSDSSAKIQSCLRTSDVPMVSDIIAHT
jgi:hypothetical protein